MALLAGKVAVVTGANGGIGRAICEAFTREGARVVGIDRDALPSGHPAEGRQIDVTKFDEIAALAKGIHTLYGKLDIWVNNAGFLARGPALEVTPDAWRETIAVNLDATFFGAQAAARVMSEKGGAIINLSSYAGIKARPQCAAYAAAKAAVAHLTACLATEWGPLGIRVNALAPGYIETPMSAWMHQDPMQRAALLSRTPLGRIGQPEEIASAATFLASDTAAFITGQTLGVDGGAVKT